MPDRQNILPQNRAQQGATRNTCYFFKIITKKTNTKDRRAVSSSNVRQRRKEIFLITRHLTKVFGHMTITSPLLAIQPDIICEITR